MNTNSENQAKCSDTSKALESLLHQVLREDAKVFPVSEEDIRNLEAEIDPTEFKRIDPSRLLARIRREKPQESGKVIPLHGNTSPEIDEDLLAMAARNGSQITEAVRLQMEQDRAKAEKDFDPEK